MDSYPTPSQAELNSTALDHFVYQPVDKQMIRYLAKAAAEVIQCDPTMMPPPAANKRYPSPPRTPSPRAVTSSDGVLPSIEDFITQLVVSSNVQVPTLMSTLVYLNRLKSRLQPMAKGLRCTTHRIFLASLILAAKYLNDSSPKNKHWATYSVVSTQAHHFGFSRTEVNLMEKQLLFLLDWDLRITEDDLYASLDPFLAPLRQQPPAHPETTRAVSTDHAYAYATPPASRGSSRSRNLTANHSRASSRDVSPPGLSSSASSYAGSVSEASTSSRAVTPCTDADADADADLGSARTRIYDEHAAMFDSPMQAAAAAAAGLDQAPAVPAKDGRKLLHGGMLPYEISAEEMRGLEQRARAAGAKKNKGGVWGRVWGAVGAR
ncbi:cyclin [Trichocladium antarcticum]|uniref:Cyclin n=1 Tax=Trichocladium antarcticum TaxID=1450529 RepID=A0AAN6ULY3_9PEZI|nr:cyclin [Trichocladium antarcticum]